MKGHFRGEFSTHRARNERRPPARVIAAKKRVGPGSSRPPEEPAALSGMDANRRRPEDVLAGLPADVMDELVADLAEAVVAILLSQAAADAYDEDDASGDLREI